MTQIKFSLDMSCIDGGKCSDSFRLKLLDKFGNDNNTWHFSCFHKNGAHLFFFYFYSKDGMFENEALGKIETIEDKRIKKFSGPIPTETELKNLILS